MGYPARTTVSIEASDTLLNLLLDPSAPKKQEIDDAVLAEPLVEEVVIGNEFEDTPSVIRPRKTDHRYTQVNKLKGSRRHFKIYNDIFLQHSFESFRNKGSDSTRINLTYIDPDPEHEMHFAWNWLYASLMSFCLGILMFYPSTSNGFGAETPYLMGLGILFITASLLSALSFLYRSEDRVTYHSLAGRVPLITLGHRPKRPDYQIFVDIIKLHVSQAQERQGLSKQQRLKGELTELRRLNEEGVITLEAYERARALIFKNDFKGEE